MVRKRLQFLCYVILALFFNVSFVYAQQDTIMLPSSPPDSALQIPHSPLILDLSIGNLEIDKEENGWLSHQETSTGVLFLPIEMPIDSFLKDMVNQFLETTYDSEVLMRPVIGQNCKGILFNILERYSGSNQADKLISFSLVIGDSHMSYWLYATYPISKHVILGPMYGGLFQSIYWDATIDHHEFFRFPFFIDLKRSDMSIIESYGGQYIRLASNATSKTPVKIEFQLMELPASMDPTNMSHERLSMQFDHYMLDDLIIYFDDKNQMPVSQGQNNLDGIVFCTKSNRTVFFSANCQSKTELISKLKHFHFKP